MKSLVLLVSTLCLATAHPSLRAAALCEPTKCLIEDDCRCSSVDNPIENATDPAPQLIVLTVSESIVSTVYNNYLSPLLFDRVNPDGRPIGATFFVNHEYTDYELVQNLYLRGFEIGVHSITKNASQEYWRTATLEDLVEEFGGQREIISTFANIPIDDIIGGRTPQLQLQGDVSINAYIESGLSYDNSWPTSSLLPYLPYTLDYASTQQCQVTIKCPTNTHEHFWIAPITDIRGLAGVECNSLATCFIQGTAEDIRDWLISQIDRVEADNRVPLVLRLDSYWFDATGNSYEGFELFLDEMQKRDDVFFVSVQDAIEWVRNPVGVSEFKTTVRQRSAKCTAINCRLTMSNGSERYMKSCVPCPDQYPWKGNPLGNNQTLSYV